MSYWKVREELSLAGKLRRTYYELLRDELDQSIIKYGLINSYNNFVSKGIPYPFVEKRELKPRARIPDMEYESQNAYLVIFSENYIPDTHKKYIRFFDVNRTSKTNLLQSKTLPLTGKFDRSQKFLESVHFFDFLKVLLPVDYALLIQRDPFTKNRDKYLLSHFHVRIDWPIADAAEDLGKYLRYISKDLYEKNDKYAEDVQKKFFEYYGMPVMAGGRRTAAIVAAQYLKSIPCIHTVYAGSSESRSLIRISERGTSKAVLIKISNEELKIISASIGLSKNDFIDNYVVATEGSNSICTFLTTYEFTDHARPPEDGKLREIKPDLNWLSVGGQSILPKPGVWQSPPISYNIIYS